MAKKSKESTSKAEARRPELSRRQIEEGAALGRSGRRVGRDMDAMAPSLKDVSDTMRDGGIESITLTWQPLTDEFAVIRGIVNNISCAVDAAVGQMALIDQLGLREQKS
jgi:hypothetical protein